MQQVKHKGAVQGRLAFLPKRVIGMCVFRGGVANKIGDQLQHIGVVADVVERVVAVGAIRVNEVENLDRVPLPEQQGDGVAGKFPFRVSRYIRCVGLVNVGLHDVAGLARAGAAHHDLQEVSEMLAAV